MAYNAVSGTLIAAQNYLPANDSIVANILSGNLSTSDGASVVNVPRVTNAGDNRIITNVGGDANSLTCEGDLTFDGETLNVVGDISASIGISASIFVGDGSRLTGISGSGGGANASGPTNSIQLKLENGNISGSNDLSFNNNILVVNGGLTFSRRYSTQSITASTNDFYIGMNSTNAPLSVTLPSADLLGNGQAYVVKDEGGASNTNNITISASGSQTIDGSNSIVLESPYASVQLYCNGNDKFYIY
jgi:hypothetical protein